MASTAFDRATALRRLGREDFDVLVVGGGITGAGVALDAATRGLRTALVERDDFASGTSSRSSKLVHGGLRYLDQREFRLVYEALAERQRLLENAPHLVSILPFLVPVLRHDGPRLRRLAPVVGAGLWLYDLTGGWRVGRTHRKLTLDDALAHFPSLDRARLRGAFAYFDAHADDARLTLAVARTAAAHGAVVANHARVTGFVKHAGKVVGAHVADADAPDRDAPGSDASGSDASTTVRARTVVNATGVWADDVRALDEGTHPASLQPAKGVHITLPWERVRNDLAAILPVPGDARSVFVIPWGPRTYVGTTDTAYDGDVDDPRCTTGDVDYLLAALNGITNVAATRDDVVATWAGLRPLVRGSSHSRTADLSRRHAVHRSPSGVVTVTGGKLTTYRRMAADAVDVALRTLGARHDAPSVTARLKLLGADGVEPATATVPAPGPAPAPTLAEHLAGRFGSEAASVRALVDSSEEWTAPLVPGLPYRTGEAIFAVREEMAVTLDDVLSRRTRARVLDATATALAAARVAQVVAPELGWSAARAAEEVAHFRAQVEADRC